MRLHRPDLRLDLPDDLWRQHVHDLRDGALNHLAIVEQPFAHGVPVVLDTETCLNEGMAGYYNGRVIAICMTGNGWDEENKERMIRVQSWDELALSWVRKAEYKSAQ